MTSKLKMQPKKEMKKMMGKEPMMMAVKAMKMSKSFKMNKVKGSYGHIGPKGH